MYDVNAMDDLPLSQCMRKATSAELSIPVFSAENFDDTDDANILEVNDCEQLVYALRKMINTWDGTKEIKKILLNPKDKNGNEIDGFYFQNYEGLKEGLNSGLFNYNDSVDKARGIIEIRPKRAGTVIIQGVQTQTYFAYFYMTANNNTIIKFYDIYFKDCVCTKTSNMAVFQYTANSKMNVDNYLYFENCKVSMHIRTGEYSPIFDNGYSVSPIRSISWYNCSRYIEFSDLVENNMASQAICLGITDKCSTIIRNAAILGMRSGDDDVLIGNSTNSSWDIEIYDLVKKSGGWDYIRLAYLNNCFLRVYNFDLTNLGELLYFYMDGVNIVTTNAEQTSNSNVKYLSEEDCRNPAILNKWGFFTKTLPSSS